MLRPIGVGHAVKPRLCFLLFAFPSQSRNQIPKPQGIQLRFFQLCRPRRGDKRAEASACALVPHNASFLCLATTHFASKTS